MIKYNAVIVHVQYQWNTVCDCEMELIFNVLLVCVSVQKPEDGGGHDWGNVLRFQGAILQWLGADIYHYHYHTPHSVDGGGECPTVEFQKIL